AAAEPRTGRPGRADAVAPLSVWSTGRLRIGSTARVCHLWKQMAWRRGIAARQNPPPRAAKTGVAAPHRPGNGSRPMAPLYSAGRTQGGETAMTFDFRGKRAVVCGGS